MDVLMQAAEEAQPLAQQAGNERSQAGQSWAQYLWDAQRIAVSAASAVGSVPQMLPSVPNRIHFGQSSSWEKVQITSTLRLQSVTLEFPGPSMWVQDATNTAAATAASAQM